MKKLMLLLTALALIVSMGAMEVLAAGRRSHDAGRNADGICGSHGACQGQRFADEDGDGICDNQGICSKENYPDENGGGVCGHRSTPPDCGGRFQDRHHGNRHRRTCH